LYPIRGNRRGVVDNVKVIVGPASRLRGVHVSLTPAGRAAYAARLCGATWIP